MPVMFHTLLSRVTLSRSKPRITGEQTSPMVPPNLLSDDDDFQQKLFQELSDTIESTKESVIEMENSERFLDVRVRKYRQLLAEEAVRTSQEDDATMTPEERLQRIRKQEQYHLQLCDVMDVQRNILAEVETLKRKLNELEKKRDEWVQNRQECEELLMARAALELEHNEGGENSGDENVDVEQGERCEELEMGSLNLQYDVRSVDHLDTHTPREVD